MPLHDRIFFYAFFGCMPGSGFFELSIVRAYQVQGGLGAVVLRAGPETLSGRHVEVVREWGAWTVRYVFFLFPNSIPTLLDKIEDSIVLYIFNTRPRYP